MAFYTWTHRKEYLDAAGNQAERTKLYLYRKDPPFARKRYGIPVQILRDHDYNACLTLIDDLQKGKFRPEYIITFAFQGAAGFGGYEACEKKFESLNLYEQIMTQITGVHSRPYSFVPFRRDRLMYKLKDGLVPF